MAAFPRAATGRLGRSPTVEPPRRRRAWFDGTNKSRALRSPRLSSRSDGSSVVRGSRNERGPGLSRRVCSGDLYTRTRHRSHNPQLHRRWTTRRRPHRRGNRGRAAGVDRGREHWHRPPVAGISAGLSRAQDRWGSVPSVPRCAVDRGCRSQPRQQSGALCGRGSSATWPIRRWRFSS